MRRLSVAGMLLGLGVMWATMPGFAADRSQPPPPTEPRPFVLPAVAEGALSNGIRVVVVESHEIPFVWVTLSISASPDQDPVGKEGLAMITLDMLNEGAGAYDAAGLSGALKALGSNLSSSVGSDGASVGIRSLSRNLGATLDLMADVVLKPGFPASEWEILQKQYLASLQTDRSDPSLIAARLLEQRVHGQSYRGRQLTEASVKAIDPAAMRGWYDKELGPARATLLVGGDTTLAQVLPELERRFGGWKGAAGAVEPLGAVPPVTQNTLFVAHKAGAAQSVIQAEVYVAAPTDADYFPLVVANHVMGGQFASRINLNLREKNGYTYGARSSVAFDRRGARLSVSTSVKTDVTAAAMKELLYELNGPSTGRAFDATEVADATSAIVSARPLRFESPEYLLRQLENISRYNLPSDWVSTYAANVAAVDPPAANDSWSRRMTQDGALRPMVWVIVGDLTKIREPLAGLGFPMVELDVDGAELKGG